MSKIIAIIPAREGSKRLPGKNKRDFCGKPLVQWTIEAAQKCKDINKIILTSNDLDILHIGSKLGVDCIDRDPALCKDDTPAWDVANNVMKWIEADINDIIVYLQPTSPLRNFLHITSALLYFKIMKCTSMISATQFNKLHYGFTLDKGFLVPIFHAAYLENRSQDLPAAYIPNGAIYIIKYEDFIFYRSFYGPLTRMFRMNPEHSVDIDTMEEWLYAEFLMRVRLMKENE